MMCKEKTEDEVREEFLSHVRNLIDYWDTVGGPDAPPDAPKTQKDRLAGLAFSIMVMLDGGACELPGYVVAPNPHPDDKQYHIDQGSDYYTEAPKVKCDISGCLHELLNI